MLQLKANFARKKDNTYTVYTQKTKPVMALFCQNRYPTKKFLVGYLFWLNAEQAEVAEHV